VLAIVAAAAATALLAAEARALTASALKQSLGRHMRRAGPASGAFVLDLSGGRALFALRENVSRIPASVNKLYTTSTALLRLGSDERLVTTVSADAPPDATGAIRGNLYLRGRGDPTFGSATFVARRYPAGATVEALATEVAAAGATEVEGGVRGDESFFDARRGGPRTGYRFDSDLGGVLSALSYDRGLRATRPPAEFAAGRLATALRAAGVRVKGRSGAGRTPIGALELGRVASPTVRTLVRLTNQPSDNFFAEMLLKGLGARFGSGGTTAAGAAVVRRSLARFGIHPRIADGSGLSRANRTTPRQIVRLLNRMEGQESFPAFFESLALAGRSGTLDRRMRRTAAAGRCAAKTGTLNFVSALAGYCLSRGERLVAFAFLMNGVNVVAGRRLQDRMTVAIARYGE
jgi:D-alanyl-D-alanine carboxypeptidase/D-alanyl-D-alanine-endopeptidase (penicillin-binding protein 4)